jgi:hypothetical protein
MGWKTEQFQKGWQALSAEEIAYPLPTLPQNEGFEW